jgi:hypothetical protein
VFWQCCELRADDAWRSLEEELADAHRGCTASTCAAPVVKPVNSSSSQLATKFVAQVTSNDGVKDEGVK